MTFTAGEVAKKFCISKDTLRYYEKEGLLPPISRNTSGHRVFTESDMDWIFLIKCLRNTDMPISVIKQYVSLLMQGENSINERRNILLSHQKNINEKINLYNQLSKLIEKKIEFYDDALKSEDNLTKCIDYKDEWEHFRSILGGTKYE